MRIQSQIELLPFFVDTLANRPRIRQQIESIYVLIVLHYIPLPSDQDKVGKIAIKSVIP